MDATPPPLGAKLTVYRLVFMTTVLSFGAVKSILAYKGQSIAPTTLDWVSGTFLTVVLYWLGLYEGSSKWKWFFQVDFAPALGYCAMRAVAEFIWLLFDLDGLPIVSSLINSLNWLFVYVSVCYLPHVSPLSGAGIAVGFSIVFWTMLIGLVVRLTARRVLNRGRKCAMGFVDIYAPSARHAERYESFGAVGTRVRFVCGIALIFLPFVVFCMTAPDDPYHC